MKNEEYNDFIQKFGKLNLGGIDQIHFPKGLNSTYTSAIKATGQFINAGMPVISKSAMAASNSFIAKTALVNASKNIQNLAFNHSASFAATGLTLNDLLSKSALVGTQALGMANFEAMTAANNLLNPKTLALHMQNINIDTKAITRMIVAGEITNDADRGWLSFGLVGFREVIKYLDALGVDDDDEHEYDIDSDVLKLELLKSGKLDEIIEELVEANLVEGIKYLPLMLKSLKENDEAYKTMFQYVFSLIDATFLFQRNKAGDLGAKVSIYNDSPTVRRYSNAVQLASSKLEEQYFLNGLKTRLTINTIQSYYQTKNNFRNKLMHGNIDYDELTETKFYQLVVVLYQLTFGIDLILLARINKNQPVLKED